MRVFLTSLLLVLCVPHLQAQTKPETLAAAKKAVSFLTDHVSNQGGYLWRYSEDLSRREGEGVVTTQTVWVQPPGTPSLGEAFLDLFEATGDPQFLNAASEVGSVLLKGQMRSGGWQAQIELEPERRRKWQYRVDPPTKKGKDQSSLDDNKTQASLHFLIRLDKALKQKDEAIHEAALYGLTGLLRMGQLPGGGFPQVWIGEKIKRPSTMLQPASYPNEWSRQYTGHQEYWYRYTLNDNLAGDVVKVLILADKVYGDAATRDALLRFADSLIRTQMPSPQPAWAQQYSDAVQPIWARKFEPPAITTSESYDVIRTLMMICAYTEKTKYLEPIPKALDYLETCRLDNGQVARFYELRTNRPLYFNRQYELTYSDEDMPTHYGFQLRDQSESLRRQYEAFAKMTPTQRSALLDRKKSVSEKTVREILSQQDTRGAWVTDVGLRFHKKSNDPADQRVIDMQTAVGNLKALAAYLQ